MERKKIFLKFLLKRAWFLTVLVALGGMVFNGCSSKNETSKTMITSEATDGSITDQAGTTDSNGGITFTTPVAGKSVEVTMEDNDGNKVSGLVVNLLTNGERGLLLVFDPTHTYQPIVADITSLVTASTTSTTAYDKSSFKPLDISSAINVIKYSANFISLLIKTKKVVTTPGTSAPIIITSPEAGGSGISRDIGPLIGPLVTIDKTKFYNSKEAVVNEWANEAFQGVGNTAFFVGGGCLVGAGACIATGVGTLASPLCCGAGYVIGGIIATITNNQTAGLGDIAAGLMNTDYLKSFYPDQKFIIADIQSANLTTAIANAGLSAGLKVIGVPTGTFKLILAIEPDTSIIVDPKNSTNNLSSINLQPGASQGIGYEVEYSYFKAVATPMDFPNSYSEHFKGTLQPSTLGSLTYDPNLGFYSFIASSTGNGNITFSYSPVLIGLNNTPQILAVTTSLSLPVNIGSASTSSSTPSAPTNLTATAGNGQVALAWSASTGATSYNVYDATVSGGPYTKVGTTTNTNYTVTGLTNGTTYYFVVTAVNSNGESGYSNEVFSAPILSVSSACNYITYSTGIISKPGSITYNPITNSLWVINDGSGLNQIAQLSLDGNVISTYTLPYSWPVGIASNGFTGDVWVSYYGSSTITKMNL
ncbi:MAG: fibronectin type III domain-containing protein, partial [bacterium]